MNSGALAPHIRQLWARSWLFRHRWFCRILHQRYREATFGGYGFGGRTDRQTAIHCPECHHSETVAGWQNAVVIKPDNQITAEVKQFGREQLTPENCWQQGKWEPLYK